jgi:alanyl aminopeptidase
LRRAALPGVWVWLRSNYDALAARLGPLSAARLPALASGFCSLAERDEVEAFFRGAAPVPGRERNLALALEDVERCALARDAVGAPMRQWLSAQARAARLRDGSFPSRPRSHTLWPVRRSAGREAA